MALTNLGLWRLVVVWVAAVVTVAGSTGTCLGVILTAKQTEQQRQEQKQPQVRAGNPAPSNEHDWEALLALNLCFAAVSAVTVCVLPLACGWVWPERSVPLGDSGIALFLPQSFLGWLAYYAATIFGSLCCCLTSFALFGLAFIALGLMSHKCSKCGRPIPLGAGACPHCGAFNKDISD